MTNQSVGRPFFSSQTLRTSTRQMHYIDVPIYHHRLPHIYELEQPVFLTWRLHDCLPRNRHFNGAGTMASGEAFAAMDHLLDEARTGPFFLRQPEIAGMFMEALHYGSQHLERYDVHSFAVMPNHVHLLITPHVELPKIARTIKTFTARQANLLLNLTGKPFWQEESYDRLVRNTIEFNRIRNYIEENPVRAGLVKERSAYRWSSAWRESGP